MPSLEARIAALEVKTSPSESVIIIRSFVGPGHQPTELQSLRDGNGKEWQRQPGETEDALIDRVSVEVMRSSSGVALIFECYAC